VPAYKPKDLSSKLSTAKNKKRSLEFGLRNPWIYIAALPLTKDRNFTFLILYYNIVVPSIFVG
jgi:hypothetical protein